MTDLHVVHLLAVQLVLMAEIMLPALNGSNDLFLQGNDLLLVERL